MMANCIDILDECLSTIYKVRKLSLENRKNRYDCMKLKSSNQVNVNYNVVQETKSLGVIKKKLNLYPTSEDSSDENSDLNQTTSPRKDKRRSKEKDNIGPRGKGPPSDLEDSDTIAEHAYREFSSELKLWWDKSNNAIKEDDEAREQFADFLSEKYMCSKLDPLPPTKYVTQIRRDISRIIDEFAIKGILSSETANINFEDTITSSSKPISQHADNPINKLPNSTGSKPPDTGDTNPSQSRKAIEKESEVSNQVSKPTSHSKTTNNISSTVTNNIPSQKAASSTSITGTSTSSAGSGSDKREREKQKMQEQYQAYMKLKSGKATKDITNVPEAVNSNVISSTEESEKATKLYENNVDEIQNLLNSIKGKF